MEDLDRSPSSQDDEVLEMMLHQAGRLANEMRNMSFRGGSLDGTSVGSLVPETIQIKDSGTECSSMEANNPTDSLMLDDSPQNQGSFGDDDEADALMGSSSRGERMSAFERKLAETTHSYSSQNLRSDVDAALRASAEMARQLEALAFSPNSPMKVDKASRDSPANSPASLSPFPVSPESICGDSKTTAPVSHVTKEKENEDPLELNQENLPTEPASMDNIKWERVQYTNENDADYVPVVDYCKESKPQVQLAPRIENGIKWERVDSPRRNDEDYVQLADYSSPKRKGSFDFMPDPLPNFEKHRAALKRKRREQRRTKIIMMICSVAVAVAAGVWKFDIVQDYCSQLAAMVLPTPEPQGPSPEELAAQLAEEQRLAAERAAEERMAAERAEEQRLAAERAEEQRLAAERAEKQRLAAERAEKQRLAAERAEKQRLAAERAAEEQRLAAERAAEEQRLTGERLAAERAVEEKRLAAERAARRAAREKRLAEERAAEERRLASERAAEEERLEAERAAEEQRLAAEKAAAERAAARKKAAELKAARDAEARRKAEEEKAAEEEAASIANRKALEDANVQKYKKLLCHLPMMDLFSPECRKVPKRTVTTDKKALQSAKTEQLTELLNSMWQ